MSTKKTKLRVELIRSPIACKPSHRATVRALGLRRLHQSKEHTLSPAVAGMVQKVSYLLKVQKL